MHPGPFSSPLASLYHLLWLSFSFHQSLVINGFLIAFLLFLSFLKHLRLFLAHTVVVLEEVGRWLGEPIKCDCQYGRAEFSASDAHGIIWRI